MNALSKNEFMRHLKMNILQIVIFGIFLIQNIKSHSIKPTDFCLHTEPCQSGHYSLQCALNLCSKDKLSCQSLKLWNLINSNSKNENSKQSIQKFTNSISECPLHHQYKWTKSEVCAFKNKLCSSSGSNFPFKSSDRLILQMKTIKCKCAGKYAFTCGDLNGFCAKDKKGCDGLRLIVNKQNRNELTKCDE